MKTIYLDNAATTPMDPIVIEAMTDAMVNIYGNPSSVHATGRVARNSIEQARKQVAQALGASIGEIFFTSGGTEANNMALKCAVRDLGVKHIISSPTEHHCVIHTLERLEKEGVELTYLKVDDKGRIDLRELESLLDKVDSPTMVSLMFANNEIGTLTPFEEISEMCESRGVLFHSDTVQAVGHFPIDLSNSYVSFLSGSAHKFHGPKGVGFIYVNANNLIKPYIDGGSQERNMRGGTENIYGIIGLSRALSHACENMDERKDHIISLRNYFIELLLENFDGIRVNGDPENYLYTVLSVSFPPTPTSDLLVMNLDIHGICASGGSACSSGSEKGSHVMEAIGSDPDYKTVRFSFSHHNTKSDIDYVVQKLKTILPELVTQSVT